ncbi:hypothetical protein H310_07670 [Aphanomyces invadans]|uniref:LNR domain-containing protein n=1 Tax=Aphanomyces invadans TaxID=157072 RepID=A0A024U330_9STRA|nr:hypothetical protein H310_07670 [Aphanomyces invadans]ETW00297.1 hypothetical protein H310_07670 [Aphanomyces invadans]|eukprot:XP_008871322.1 hypothetical protein H310_07670 [Aphanomyces invadans]
MGALAAMHAYELARMYRRAYCVASSVRRRVSVGPPSPLNGYLTPAAQLGVFHSIDVVCQSYQAYRMSYYLVDRRYAFTFATVVSAYCFITPWFLFAKHAVARRSLVLLLNNCFGFVLNSVFPIAVFMFQALQLVILDRKLQNDDKFVTVSLLVGRYLMVTSPTDLISKIVMQCSSCVSIRRLVQPVTRYQSLANDPAVGPSPPPVAVHAGTTTKPSFDSFHLQFRQRRSLVVFLCLNLIWGAAMMACAAAATFFRSECPDYCVLDTSPWFDLTCSCVYVEVNCAIRGIPGATIDEFIEPTTIGTSLFALDVRRCDLPHGIPIAALQPFHSLFGVFLYMTNLSVWPADPTGLLWPPTLAALHVRGSHLHEIPEAFAVLPPQIVYFRLEGGNISTIPEAIFQAWANLSSLALSNLQLTDLPPRLGMFTGLMSLELRGNLFSSVPFLASDMDAMPWRQSVDLSANNIGHIPLSLATAWEKVALQLSSNPIATVPDAFDRRRLNAREVIMDDTPFCASRPVAAYCLPKCARQCDNNLLGNYRCDEVCYSQACSWDKGDCAAYGLSSDSF